MPIVRSGTQTRRLPSCVLPELFCQCLMIPDRLDRCDFKPQNAQAHPSGPDKLWFSPAYGPILVFALAHEGT